MSNIFTETRKHYFFDEQGNRSVVTTALNWNGQYRAVFTESDTDETDYIAYGFGHTRLAAIADLQVSLDMSRQQAEEEASRLRAWR